MTIQIDFHEGIPGTRVTNEPFAAYVDIINVKRQKLWRNKVMFVIAKQNSEAEKLLTTQPKAQNTLGSTAACNPATQGFNGCCPSETCDCRIVPSGYPNEGKRVCCPKTFYKKGDGSMCRMKARLGVESGMECKLYGNANNPAWTCERVQKTFPELM